MIRRFALALLFLSVAMLAAAGDIAFFENLGFSRDAGVFVFGQYGIHAEKGSAYAELYAVDVASNSFVTGGRFLTEDSSTEAPLSLGQDGRGALYGLVRQAHDLLERYDVNHLDSGRPIYILVDGDAPRERISFRDFNTNKRYELLLRQDQRTAGDSVEASFHVELTLTDSADRTATYTMGRAGYYRTGVRQYRITQVLLTPDENAIVVVVEKRAPDGSVRYMVETTKIN